MKKTNSTFKKVLETVSKIDGWLTGREAKVLYSLAKKVPDYQAIVEIGSWKGRSTVCLGSGTRDGKKAMVYAIDPHTGSSEHKIMFGEDISTLQDFQKNILEAGLSERVRLVQKTSVEASKKFNGLVGLIFIDGEHKYSYVQADVDSWFAKVIDGGSIAFHDSWHLLGPNIASAKLLLFSKEIRNPKLIDTITVFEKVGKNTFANRLYNVGFLSFRTLFGLFFFLRIKFGNLGGSRG
ncbi:MAG: class I SAM-dependent methyltransferase [Candidatus Falkowbacteria bacterium]|nr:class I SAM-dependent methyltransferase [Candidatus Falkowbacteria bacterium]